MSSLTVCAISPPKGSITKVLATWEMNTTALSNPVESGRRGIRPRSSSVTAVVTNPIKYQRRALNVKSATGPHKKRQRLAETPSATT
jgi:hypothetical protein